MNYDSKNKRSEKGNTQLLTTIQKITSNKSGIPKTTASFPAHTSGLPPSLLNGIESLSGLSMADVRVHRNSSKPAQFQAKAFAQGNNIHLASGEEKQLAHEAWHVVQQKQGRVKPTTQLKSIGINDDHGLEKEADVMGQKASHLSSNPDFSTSHVEGETKTLQRTMLARSSQPLQMVAIDPNKMKTLKSLIEYQTKIQEEILSGKSASKEKQVNTEAKKDKEKVVDSFQKEEEPSISGSVSNQVPKEKQELSVSSINVSEQDELSDIEKAGKPSGKDEMEELSGGEEDEKKMDSAFDKKENEAPVVNWTTVGFEHEFVQFQPNTLLHGLSHLILFKSEDKFPLKQLPFFIETDASQALELVSPPMVVNTRTEFDHIPNFLQVRRIHETLLVAAMNAAKSSETLKDMIVAFHSAGLKFTGIGQKVKIKAGHVSHDIPQEVLEKLSSQDWELDTKNELLTIPLAAHYTKGSGPGTHINVATDIAGYEELKNADGSSKDKKSKKNKAKSKVSNEKTDPLTTAVKGAQEDFRAILESLVNPKAFQNDQKELAFWFNAMSNALVQSLLVPSLRYVNQIQQKIYDSGELPEKEVIEKFKEAAAARSHIKDVDGIWLKDNITNLTIGLFKESPEALEALMKVFMTKKATETIVTNFSLTRKIIVKDQKQLKKEEMEAKGKAQMTEYRKFEALLNSSFLDMKELILRALGQFGRDLHAYLSTNQMKDNELDKDEVYPHDSLQLGVRHDTFIPASHVQLDGHPEVLHVAELREDALDRLDEVNSRE